jgi:hypothetical protein
VEGVLRFHASVLLLPFLGHAKGGRHFLLTSVKDPSVLPVLFSLQISLSLG